MICPLRIPCGTWLPLVFADKIDYEALNVAPVLFQEVCCRKFAVSNNLNSLVKLLGKAGSTKNDDTVQTL